MWKNCYFPHSPLNHLYKLSTKEQGGGGDLTGAPKRPGAAALPSQIYIHCKDL